MRFTEKLRRCRHCGIRVPRDEMLYNQLACSAECADEIWIEQQSHSDAADDALAQVVSGAASL